MWNLSSWSVVGVMLMLAGCTPATNIKHPLTASPVEKKVVAANNGAIFQVGQSERPLFEDRRARNVGDVLTIVIAETTAASGKSSSSAEHSGSFEAAVPTLTGSPGARGFLNPYGITGKSSGDLSNKSDSAGNNTFSGTITVTVIEVLANGNLLVSGEKQVAINQANEYIRFSGVVNPNTITGSNSVQSTQVADAHIEYKGANKIDLSTVMSMLGRVFLSVLPF